MDPQERACDDREMRRWRRYLTIYERTAGHYPDLKKGDCVLVYVRVCVCVCVEASPQEGPAICPDGFGNHISDSVRALDAVR
jgi:hypothetical protein